MDVQGLQGIDPAHAGQELLPNPDAVAASIEPGGRPTILGRVRLDVGVEQEEGVPPDGHLSDSCRDRGPSRLLGHRHREVVAADRELEEELTDVDVEVVGADRRGPTGAAGRGFEEGAGPPGTLAGAVDLGVVEGKDGLRGAVTIWNDRPGPTTIEDRENSFAVTTRGGAPLMERRYCSSFAPETFSLME